MQQYYETHEIAVHFNSFVPSAPFLYPLKASENRKLFRCFHAVEEGCIGNEWVKYNTAVVIRTRIFLDWKQVANLEFQKASPSHIF